MNYYPPWWGMPPPQNQSRQLSPRELDRIAQRAIKNAMRLRDQDKHSKRKRREEMAKKVAHKRQRFFSFIEIFIIGVLAHPIVGPLYHMIVDKMSHYNP